MGMQQKGCFQKIGVPENGWFRRENPIKMDLLGAKPTIFGNIQMMQPKGGRMRNHGSGDVMGQI